MRDLVFENLKNSITKNIHLIDKLRKQGNDFLDIVYDESGLYISEEEIVRRRCRKLESKLVPRVVESLNKEFATSYRVAVEEPDQFIFKMELELKKDDKKEKYIFEVYFKDNVDILLDEVDSE